MALEQISNAQVTTLVAPGGLTSNAVSMNVADASSFPQAPQFRIRIEDEIIIVTAVAGNSFAVVRGQEGTLPAVHANGVDVFHALTAGGLVSLINQSAAAGGVVVSAAQGARGASGLGPNVADGTYLNAEVIVQGGQIVTIANSYLPAGLLAPNVPALSSFTRFGSGQYNLTETINGIHWGGGNGSNGVPFDGIALPVGAGANYQLDVCFKGVNWVNNTDRVGIAIQSANNAGTYKQLLVGAYPGTGTPQLSLAGTTLTNGITPVAYNTPIQPTSSFIGFFPQYWLRLVCTSSYRTYYISVNGVDYFQTGQTARTDQFTEVLAGICCHSPGGSGSRTNFDLFTFKLTLN